MYWIQSIKLSPNRERIGVIRCYYLKLERNIDSADFSSQKNILFYGVIYWLLNTIRITLKTKYMGWKYSHCRKIQSSLSIQENHEISSNMQESLRTYEEKKNWKKSIHAIKTNNFCLMCCHSYRNYVFIGKNMDPTILNATMQLEESTPTSPVSFGDVPHKKYYRKASNR